MADIESPDPGFHGNMLALTAVRCFSIGMELQLEHIGIAARDTAALKDWYLHTLNAQLVFTSSGHPPAFFVRLNGGALLEIYPQGRDLPGRDDNSAQGWRHLALRVNSIEIARKGLESRGVVITQPVKPAGGGGQVLFFSDPEGNLLHLVERPPGSVFA